MRTIDIINSIIANHPDSDRLLDTVKVKLSDIETQFHDCNLLKSIIEVKFDINILETEGYTMRQILDVTGDSFMHDEVHKFILSKIQSHIASNN